MKSTAPPDELSVRTRTLHFNDRVIHLRYPASESMDFCFDEVYSKQDYPFLPFLNPESTAVVDVGANVGFASIWFALLYPTRTVYAFEIGREALGYLEDNARQVTNLRTFSYGWYDRDAEVDLFLGSSSCHHSIGGSSLTTSKRELTRVRRASAVLGELGITRIALLKVDTEGSEVAIFRDLEPLLDQIDSVFFEYHSEADRIEIDRLLSPRFTLYSGRVLHAHRGSFGYVSKDLIARRTGLDSCAITRPRL